MDIMVSAYLDNNIGDDLMITLMARRFPEHRFLLYSDSSVVRHTYRGIPNAVIRKPSDWDQDVKTAGAHVTIGGSLFQVTTRSQMIWRMKRIRRLARLRRRKLRIATIGSNFGPYSGKAGVKLTEWELRKNDLVTVRDREALGFLEGFRRVRNFHMADDIVYNLDWQDKIPDRQGLGISVYRSVRGGESNFQNYAALARVADRYIQTTGKPVRLLAFDSERENDLSAAHHIVNLAKEKDKLQIVPYLGDQDRFLREFSACEQMIAIRFHSAILADALKIPFLPVAYSNKMFNLMEDRQYEGRILALSDLDESLDEAGMVKQLLDPGALFSSFLEGRGNASDHFDRLEELLDS